MTPIQRTTLEADRAGVVLSRCDFLDQKQDEATNVWLHRACIFLAFLGAFFCANLPFRDRDRWNTIVPLMVIGARYARHARVKSWPHQTWAVLKTSLADIFFWVCFPGHRLDWWTLLVTLMIVGARSPSCAGALRDYCLAWWGEYIALGLAWLGSKVYEMESLFQTYVGGPCSAFMSTIGSWLWWAVFSCVSHLVGDVVGLVHWIRTYDRDCSQPLILPAQREVLTLFRLAGLSTIEDGLGKVKMYAFDYLNEWQAAWAPVWPDYLPAFKPCIAVDFLQACLLYIPLAILLYILAPMTWKLLKWLIKVCQLIIGVIKWYRRNKLWALIIVGVVGTIAVVIWQWESCKDIWLALERRWSPPTKEHPGFNRTTKPLEIEAK